MRVLLDPHLTAANGLDRAFEAHPDSVVLHLTDPTPYRCLPDDGQITLRLLVPWLNRIGNTLREAGLERGERVGVYHTNGPEYFFLGMAVVRAGGVAVPINPGMPLDGLRRHLRAAGCVMLFTDGDRFGAIGSAGELPFIRRWFFPDVPTGFDGDAVGLNDAVESMSARFEPVVIRPSDPVLLVHTSGTTGRPKLVPSTSSRLISGARRHYPDEPVRRGNRTAIAGHFNHLIYYVGLYSAILGNLPAWTLADLRPESVVTTIERERITIFFAFPDVFVGMYRLGLPERSLASVRIWVTTADASHDAHAEAFVKCGAYIRLAGRRLVPSVFVEAFGTSEVGSGALRRIRLPWTHGRLDRSIGYRTLAGPRVRLVDDDGIKVRRGEVGRIEVRGSTVFDGYWDPEDVAAHEGPENGWWWTGDLGRRSRLGRFTQLDRAVDVIQAKDGPLYSLLLEEVLLTHPGVADAVVVGVPEADGCDRPVALVAGMTGKSLSAEAVAVWAKEQPGLPGGMLDVRVVPFETLPRGLTGKILRRSLREQLILDLTTKD